MSEQVPMSKRILLVDDSSLSRRALRTMLEQVGYLTTEASDGFSAIERYSLDRPDLVMVDLIMPGLNGGEVLTKIRELDPNARVIVASADIQKTTREQAIALGAAAYLSKPFESDVVLATVARVLMETIHGPQ